MKKNIAPLPQNRQKLQDILELKKKFSAAEDLLYFANVVDSETTGEVAITNQVTKQKLCTFLWKGPVRDSLLTESRESSELLTQDYRRLLCKNINLNKKLLSFQVTIESFTDDDRVRYYTGSLSSKVLLAVFQYVELYISLTARLRLSMFQKLILVLMKLRLGTPIQDLAFRFDIFYSVASKTFKSN